MLFEWDLRSEKFGNSYVYCFQLSHFGYERILPKRKGSDILLTAYYVLGLMQSSVRICTLVHLILITTCKVGVISILHSIPSFWLDAW